MAQINIRQGESIFMDFPIEPAGTTIPATMNATFRVFDSTDVETQTGSLTKDGDSTQFELKIADTTTTAWAAGDYVLDVLVDDTANGYADFIFNGSITVTL